MRDLTETELVSESGFLFLILSFVELAGSAVRLYRIYSEDYFA
jgi:hypothetical protein